MIFVQKSIVASFGFRAGNSGLGLRSEGTAAAAAEAPDTAQGSGGCTHPVVVAMLRGR